MGYVKKEAGGGGDEGTRETSLKWMRDIEAERALIGAMMIDALTVIPMVQAQFGLERESWFDAEMALVAEKLFAMFATGKCIDILTVASAMRPTGDGDGFDVSVLEKCIDACTTAAHAFSYAETVRRHWMRRRGMLACYDLEKRLKENEDTEGVLHSAPEVFAGLVRQNSDEPTVEVLVDESVKKWWEMRARRHAGEYVLPGLPTPWELLDDLTGGLQPGLFLLAARPSAGKSTMEDAMVFHLALKGIPVGRVLLDMTLDKGVKRAISRMAGVSLPRMERGFATRVELEAADDAARLVRNVPVYQTAKYHDVSQVCSWARAMKHRHGIELLTIDFIQLMNASSGGKYFGKNEELGKITSQLKALSHDLNIPVLALSQLNRGNQKDGGRDPKLSDLRDGGSLEQDASAALFLYQDSNNPNTFFDKKEERVDRRNVWVDMQKNQNGSIGRIPFYLWANYFKFEPAPANFGVDENDGGKK
jgi:replicative DNA helicase